jgi:hypothetical protein
MPRYFDEYNRPLSYEEAFRRASAAVGTPQVYDDRGDLVPREAVLEDLGWRFGSAGARAMKAAQRASFNGLGAVGCLIEVLALPLVLLVIVNAYLYRGAFFLVFAVAGFFFARLLRESPPRITAMMALTGTAGAAWFVLAHYLPYPVIFPSHWTQYLYDPPDVAYPGVFFVLLFVWYFWLVRAAYYYVSDDGWLAMTLVLVLAGLPGAIIQGGWDPLVTRPAWARPLVALLPEGRLERLERLAAATPGPTPTAVATVTPTPAATPQPTPTPLTIRIANTGGQPVYLFRSPRLDDRLNVPYPPGTLLTIARPEIFQGDGVEWLQVRTGDGAIAYLPRQFAAPVP